MVKGLGGGHLVGQEAVDVVRDRVLTQHLFVSYDGQDVSYDGQLVSYDGQHMEGWG